MRCGTVHCGSPGAGVQLLSGVSLQGVRSDGAGRTLTLAETLTLTLTLTLSLSSPRLTKVRGAWRVLSVQTRKARRSRCAAAP